LGLRQEAQGLARVMDGKAARCSCVEELTSDLGGLIGNLESSMSAMTAVTGVR
jgi:hypothetical protein